jgi:predicted transcriptional regulator
MSSQRVLSDVNMALLKVIRESHHRLYGRLSQGGRKTAPNVSRSLYPMAQYGLVKLTKLKVFNLTVKDRLWPNGHSAGYLRESCC